MESLTVRSASRWRFHFVLSVAVDETSGPCATVGLATQAKEDQQHLKASMGGARSREPCRRLDFFWSSLGLFHVKGVTDTWSHIDVTCFSGSKDGKCFWRSWPSVSTFCEHMASRPFIPNETEVLKSTSFEVDFNKSNLHGSSWKQITSSTKVWRHSTRRRAQAQTADVVLDFRPGRRTSVDRKGRSPGFPSCCCSDTYLLARSVSQVPGLSTEGGRDRRMGNGDSTHRGRGGQCRQCQQRVS